MFVMPYRRESNSTDGKWVIEEGIFVPRPFRGVQNVEEVRVIDMNSVGAYADNGAFQPSTYSVQ